MRKILVLAMALMMGVGFSAVSMAGIAGSEHDFSGKGYGSTEICIFCHTPHGADTSVTDAPLWNHEVTTANFTPYTSATLTATDVGQPNGVSKLCLSCHDGTVAIDSFGGDTGSNYMANTDANYIGTDLGDDHPISFTYDATLASNDDGLFDPTSQTSGLGGTIDADMLFSHKLECASCHDVHDAAGNSKLLRIANSGSDLCLTCHNK